MEYKIIKVEGNYINVNISALKKLLKVLSKYGVTLGEYLRNIQYCGYMGERSFPETCEHLNRLFKGDGGHMLGSAFTFTNTDCPTLWFEIYNSFSER
jgi:hypothetical protein